MNCPLTLANVGTKLLNNAFSIKATLDDDLCNFGIILFNLMQLVATLKKTDETHYEQRQHCFNEQIRLNSKNLKL